MRLDGAAMQHRAMADCHIIPENQGAFVPHHMADGAVLNVRMHSDADDVHVPPNDAVVPDAGVVANFHVADNLGAFSDINTLSQFRPLSHVLMQHYRSLDKTSTLTELLNFT